MHLEQVIQNLSIKRIQENSDVLIKSIHFDSREVKEDSLFVAVKGVQVDGHQYIDMAIRKGAIAIVCEVLPDKLVPDVCYLQVDNSANSLGYIAGNFYGHPSKKMNLVGVTGTNGKTTTATLLYNLFSKLGYTVGLLSTVENRIGDRVLSTTHTTPNALKINELLAEMHMNGCTHVFMEVSSHAVEQGRITGLVFKGGLFSNLSHDHLDYHKTYKNYIYAKKKFFDGLSREAFALTNLDDKQGRLMLQNTQAAKKSYALNELADFKGKIIEMSRDGLLLEFNQKQFHSRLVGDFNAYNLLLVYGAAISLGENEEEVLQALSAVQTAEGRFDSMQSAKENITGIVDYAHTPDALEKVLKTISNMGRGQSQIITVVGCGGDRDKTKRPKMAAIAVEMSDWLILTSDNPRTEDPETILDDMEKGIKEWNSQLLRISSRREAIEKACHLAKSKDIILIAGKGHEKYQEIMGVKEYFDDKAFLAEYLAKR